MPTLSVLHISDLHITEYNKTTHLSGYDRKVAIALAEFAVARRDEFDKVLITGDLARTGRPSDLAAAYEFLFAPPGPSSPFMTPDMRPTLAGLNRELWLMPGNHDCYQTVLGDPGCCVFDTVFSAHWKAGLRGIQTFRQRLDDEYSVSIIAGDCCLRYPTDASPPLSKRAIAGQGWASIAGASGLEQMTRDERNRDQTKCAIVWALHFPPTEPKAISSTDLWLVDSERISEAADRANVNLIVAGHLHEQGVFQTTLKSGSLSSPTWCAGSPCALWYPQWMRSKLEHMVHLMEIKVGETGRGHVDVTRRNFQYDPSSGFVENGQKTSWTI